MGSGHILVYAFDVFMQIYENAGWSAREAAQSIVEHNIYGLDIDDRAAQLSYFAVMMKARQYDRRIFTRGVRPNVYAIQESNGINREQLKYFGAELDEMEKNTAILQIEGLLDTLIDAKEYGSILNVDEYDWDLLRRWVNGSDMGSQITFDTYGLDETAEKLKELIEIGAIMAQKYEVVATNPPYAGTSNLSAKVNNFVKKYYPDSKADLFAVFIERCGEMLKKNGYQAMITQHSWMFLSSYEKLREKLQQRIIVNMAHLGARAFEEIGGEVVQTTSFIMRKTTTPRFIGKYVRLVEGRSQQEKEKIFLLKENIYRNSSEKYSLIPGMPIAYWVSSNIIKLFQNPLFYEYSISDGQNKTGNNAKYVREYWEVNNADIGINKKWLFYAKGGGYRKWYGNLSEVVDWSEETREFYRKDSICRIIPEYLWYKVGITWSLISNNPSFRVLPQDATFDVGGSSIFLKDDLDLNYYLGLFNSVVFEKIQKITNPTINIQVKDIRLMPIIKQNYEDVSGKVKSNISLTKEDWDSFETSWDFKRHPLLSVIPRNSVLFDDTNDIDLAECYTCWENECNERFNLLKANEEELNRIFIDIYGLQDELTSEVEDKDVTVRKADLQRDIKSLISYAVGCMFGRYSLDEEGLIYAGGEWDESRYTTFIPDKDNIIPITDEEYLEDDIVSRFCTWLKTAFGAKSLETNLDFIAKALGNKGDTSREIIRNYFLNDFFKDHCNTYSVTGSGKRPIYWLFDSGKHSGFKALVYLHRYNADTIGNVRVDYLYRMQRVYESEIGRMQDTIDNSKNSREVSLATKRKEKLQKQLKECREYDEKIGHLALSRIELDLDDGVKVNYRKVQTASDGKFYEILADSKNIMVKEKLK